ncbi:MAG TPA: hydrogenase expression protein HypE, partial [Actinomycetota bacterium]|nr:hydrogenase expression protein HypE [Actinomycetota bacterium]
MPETAPAPMKLSDVLRAGRHVENHAPWPRTIVNHEGWRRAAASLSAGQWTLLGLWAERDRVHVALNDGGDFGVVSLACDDKRFPSIGASHPPAIRLERAIRDLWGLEPEGLGDTRPWLD